MYWDRDECHILELNGSHKLCLRLELWPKLVHGSGWIERLNGGLNEHQEHEKV